MTSSLKRLGLGVLITISLSWQIAIASDTLITVLIGDKDCFGLEGVCSDGDHYFIDLGGTGADNRGPGDPLGTDQFGTSVPLGGPSFTVDLDLGGATPVSASIELLTAGIELVGATFYFNGTNIGFYTEPDGLENRAATVVFDVPIALLTTQNILTLSVPDSGLVQDGFVIDYVELRVETGCPTSEFVATYTFPGGSIFGYLPVPQVNGFDYYFTPVMLDASILGAGVTITSVEVSAFGQNNGEVVNFDWEVHIGPTSFGLPEGQLIQTLVDPIAGYVRIAPTQFRFTIGNQVDSQSYQFSGLHDFVSGTTIANPYFSLVQAAVTTPMTLTEGLYAQVFLWTADNRNSRIDFDQITLTVRGQMPTVPGVIDIPVVIDIIPGNSENKIDPNSTKAIWVVVFSSTNPESLFDPSSQIDIPTAEFGPDGANAIRSRVRDINRDGLGDLMLLFNISDTGIACGETTATLTGKTFGNESFAGTDAINTVRCR